MCSAKELELLKMMELRRAHSRRIMVSTHDRARIRI
jgi:hypothetical protein